MALVAALSRPTSSHAILPFLHQLRRGYAVVSVSSDKEFKSTIDTLSDKNGVAIVDFTAKWCGPCRFIAPHFEQLSKDHPEIKFVKVDIDTAELGGTVRDHNVTGVPTFTIYKGAQRVESFTGARLDYLKECIKKYGGK